MSTVAVARPTPFPLQTRLSRLADLTPVELQVVQAAQRDQRRSAARQEILVERDPVHGPRAIVSGWAAHQRNLADGRRQIVSLLVPGDLIGRGHQNSRGASTSILAITDVVTCPAPDAEGHPALLRAYALGAAMEHEYLLAHVTRLGRLNARERLVDWILETQDRLELAGLASGDRFDMPLTQDMLADTLGLTNVHVNRIIQTLRREGMLDIKGGVVSVPSRPRLEHLTGYQFCISRDA